MSEITHPLLMVNPSKELKKWTYTARDRTVFAPIDGKVSNVNQSSKSLVIKHSSGYKCKITGINDILVGNGDDVVMNDIIGKIKVGEKVTLEVLDKNNITQVIAPFFAGTAIGFSGSRKQKTKKSENETSTDSKQKKNTTTYNDNLPKDTKPYDPGDLSFLDIALAPLHLLGAGWKYITKKKKDEDEENLTEEINRIKELLK